jgi:Xaa-Pro dipeptidase
MPKPENSFPLDRIQRSIREEGLDGWLFYDFHGSDPIARRILQVPGHHFQSRRWFCFIPAAGEPVKLMHKIEPNSLDHLSGIRWHYAGWRELEGNLSQILNGKKRIAMNYSPRNAVPYVSRVDAGTLEMVRSTGVEVASAADLIQQFESVWTEKQLMSHIRAAKGLRKTVDDTFSFVAKSLRKKKSFREYDVQQFMLKCFGKYGLVTADPPIAAVGPNSGNPHYGPQRKGSSRVKKGDFLLIDLWAKEKKSDSVYADITWTGFIGEEVPEKYEKVFQVVRGGRDAALRLVTDAVKARRVLSGAEVDDAARNYIASKGYGDQFIHRTGHSIGLNVHGNGANIDNFETREERKILPNTCFSIEPGVYLKEFGIRSEIDVFVSEKEATVYGQPLQATVVPILKKF